MTCHECNGTGETLLPRSRGEFLIVTRSYGEVREEWRSYELPPRIDICSLCAKRAEFEYQLLLNGGRHYG